jgi:hypothetical protein
MSADPGPFLTLTLREMWDRNEELNEKLDGRLKRLEIVVALLAVYAFGQGGASVLSRFAG